MTIQFNCDKCGATLTVLDAGAGQMIQCPCSNLIKVPGEAVQMAEAVIAPSDLPPRPSRVDLDDDDVSPSKYRETADAEDADLPQRTRHVRDDDDEDDDRPAKRRWQEVDDGPARRRHDEDPTDRTSDDDIASEREARDEREPRGKRKKKKKKRGLGPSWRRAQAALTTMYQSLVVMILAVLFLIVPVVVLAVGRGNPVVAMLGTCLFGVAILAIGLSGLTYFVGTCMCLAAPKFKSWAAAFLGCVAVGLVLGILAGILEGPQPPPGKAGIVNQNSLTAPLILSMTASVLFFLATVFQVLFFIAIAKHVGDRSLTTHSLVFLIVQGVLWLGADAVTMLASRGIFEELQNGKMPPLGAVLIVVLVVIVGYFATLIWWLFLVRGVRNTVAAARARWQDEEPVRTSRRDSETAKYLAELDWKARNEGRKQPYERNLGGVPFDLICGVALVVGGLALMVGAFSAQGTLFNDSTVLGMVGRMMVGILLPLILMLIGAMCILSWKNK